MPSVFAAIRNIARSELVRAAVSGGEINRRTLTIAYVAITVVSCGLRSIAPVYAIGMAAQDDFLFVRLARNIVDFHWLGPFDNLTLVKGMGFPAFIAIAFAFGIPLKLAEHLLYLGAGGAMAWVVQRLSGNKLLALILFGVLAFSPVLWTEQFARIVRESFYIGLTLMIVAVAIIVLLAPARTTRAHKTLLLVLGVLVGWFWVTREEGIWLVPTLAVLAIGACVQAIWLRPSSAPRMTAWQLIRRGTIAALLVVMPFGAVICAVATANYYRYGVFTTDEMRSDSFRAGFGALARIRHETWRPLVIAPKEAREQAYAVSEAARELRPALEGRIGEFWRKVACRGANPEACPEILTGWFMWAFRDAVQAAGHYANGRAAMAYYDRLAAEIDAACRDGRLSCLPERKSVIPPFRPRYLQDSLVLVPMALRQLMIVGSLRSRVPSSSDARSRIDFFADMAGAVPRRRSPIVFVRGITSSESMRPQVLVQDRAGDPYNLQLDVFPPAGPWFTIFELTTDCLRPSCELVVRTDVKTWSAPISALKSGSRYAPGDIEVTIEIAAGGRGSIGGAVFSPVFRLIHRLAFVISHIVYGLLTPVLAFLAVVGLTMAFVWRRHCRLPFALWTVVLTCAAAVASRVAAIVYVHVTMFPAIRYSYLSSAIPFLQIFIVLGIYMGAVVWLGRHDAASRAHA